MSSAALALASAMDAVFPQLQRMPVRVNATEVVALDLIQGNHAQIMDMLGRDPQGAPDEAWDRAAEILIESMHACVTVIQARRNRKSDDALRPLVTRTIRPGETMAQYAARVMGYPA